MLHSSHQKLHIINATSQKRDFDPHLFVPAPTPPAESPLMLHKVTNKVNYSGDFEFAVHGGHRCIFFGLCPKHKHFVLTDPEKSTIKKQMSEGGWMVCVRMCVRGGGTPLPNPILTLVMDFWFNLTENRHSVC